MVENIKTKPKKNIGWYLDKSGKVISFVSAIVLTIISIYQLLRFTSILSSKNNTDKDETDKVASVFIIAGSLIEIFVYWIIVFLARKFRLFSQIYTILFIILLISNLFD